MTDDLVESLRTREGRARFWETVKGTDDILKMLVFKAVIGVLEEKDRALEKVYDVTGNHPANDCTKACTAAFMAAKEGLAR